MITVMRTDSVTQHRTAVIAVNDAEAVGYVCGGKKLGGHVFLPFFVWEMREEGSFHW